MSKDQTTEQNILNAAEKVFISTGYDGARMQAIANEANINKAMLHYYFKSKDMLFEKVFDEKAKCFFPQILEIAEGELDFIEKIESECAEDACVMSARAGWGFLKGTMDTLSYNGIELNRVNFV